MAISKGKTEGGSGGKRGHSNMEHWEFTEEIKESTKTLRRENEKKEIRKEVDDYENNNKQ